MLNGLTVGGVVSGLGPWALAAAIAWYVVRKVLKGDLVPKDQHQAVIAQVAYLRTVVDTQMQVNLKQGMSIERLLVLAETSTHALAEIQATLEPRGDR